MIKFIELSNFMKYKLSLALSNEGSYLNKKLKLKSIMIKYSIFNVITNDRDVYKYDLFF